MLVPERLAPKPARAVLHLAEPPPPPMEHCHWAYLLPVFSCSCPPSVTRITRAAARTLWPALTRPRCLPSQIDRAKRWASPEFRARSAKAAKARAAKAAKAREAAKAKEATEAANADTEKAAGRAGRRGGGRRSGGGSGDGGDLSWNVTFADVERVNLPIFGLVARSAHKHRKHRKHRNVSRLVGSLAALVTTSSKDVPVVT